MSALSDLLQEAIGAGVSVPQALDRMAEAGLEVNRSQTYKAVKGVHAKRPSERVLQAYSIGFDIPITKLRAAVGAPEGELGPYEPPRYADRLSHEQRRALNELIRTIVDTGSASVVPEAGGPSPATVTELPQRTYPGGEEVPAAHPGERHGPKKNQSEKPPSPLSGFDPEKE